MCFALAFCSDLCVSIACSLFHFQLFCLCASKRCVCFFSLQLFGLFLTLKTRYSTYTASRRHYIYKSRNLIFNLAKWRVSVTALALQAMCVWIVVLNVSRIFRLYRCRGLRRREFFLNALYKYSQRLLTLASTLDFNYAACLPFYAVCNTILILHMYVM